MPYDPNRHHRRSIRLKSYDYSQVGAYFVTICTHKRSCLFGDIVDGEMQLNDIGFVVRQCWLEIPSHFPHVALDAFIIMPNHIHGILWIVETPETVGAKNCSPLPPSSTQHLRGTSKTIGSIVRGFKIGVIKLARRNTGTNIVWQRNYYEHIIRNEEDLNTIRRYIMENPLRWHIDRENPARVPVKAVHEPLIGGDL